MMDEQGIELVTILHSTFTYESEKIKLYINEQDEFVIKVNNYIHIGTKLLNLDISSSIFVHIYILDSTDNISLYINGEELFSIKNNNLKILKKTYEIFKSKQLIDYAITESDLSLWVNFRISKFKIKTDTSGKYELVSLINQEEQLKETMASLEDLITLVIGGKKNHINGILAILRSLLYYNDGKNYDPLLLRIAAIKKVALPIYVNPYFEEHGDDLFFSISSFASIISTGSNTKRMDFQEYLTSNTIVVNNELYSLLYFIGSASNTKSNAHFDQRIPKEIMAMNHVPTLNEVDIFNRIIIDLSKLAIDVFKQHMQK